jgi:phage shock protein PspC (stress-responsive transcriptional regulator)
MDKTININLAGTLFKIDEEAFLILRDYMQAINNRFGNETGGHETIEDIESRIAEIFQTQKGLAGVVTKENVDSMISIIGKPEDFDQGEPESKAPAYSVQKRKMYRNTEDKIIGGVCSGIAAYLDTDPVLFRILFVLFAIFFGAGFFIYIALWIALPAAGTDSQKRTMYGNAYHPARSQAIEYNTAQVTGVPHYNTGFNNSSRLGNAINEIFRAVGSVFYIILRIFLIIIGVVLVLTGFLFILSFVMVFFFKFPGVFSIDSSGVNLINFTDFLNYVVNPSAVPWIIILTSVAFILPMIAIIYWGVKMIFWFRANDGAVSLIALVVWVISIAALTIIGFNEGISFAQTAKTSAQIILPHSPDTLYVKSENKIADLKYDKGISLPHEEYSVYINDEKRELYIRPYLNADRSDDKTTRVEVRKRSAGRTMMDAMKKAEGLLYNYSIKGDTLHLDEYFTCPAGRKWSADNVKINLYVPTGTVLKFENDTRILLHSSFRNEYDEYPESLWESDNTIWIMTDDGLKTVTENSFEKK